MRGWSALTIAAAFAACTGVGSADEAPVAAGSGKFAAYMVCRTLTLIDMGPVGSQSAAECTGVVRRVDGSKLLDNLGIHCLEVSRARADGYRFFGTCVQTDAVGDKLAMTYEGPESGPMELIGGTGKYKDIVGSGQWSVADAPGNTTSLFVFTLSYEATWKHK